MKKILILTLSIIHFYIFSQKKEISYSFPNKNLIYVELPTLIELNNISNQYNVRCEGCNTFEKISGSKNKWKLKATEIGNLVITVKNKREQIIFEQKIKIVPIPTPHLCFDQVFYRNELTSIPSTIQLKLSEEIPLQINYFIKSWIIKINDSTFSGIGYNLSDEILSYLKLTSQGLALIEIIYLDPFSEKKMKSYFEFNL